MNMKNRFLYSTAAIVLALGLGSCVNESPKYTEGEPDADGCYGVYFPNQEAAGDHTFDPSDPTTVTFKAVRTVSSGSITVPLTVTDTSANKVFQVGTLSFADGQKESTVTVNFPDAELGVQYGLSINIEDPQYASKYASGDFGISFSALREKWNTLGKAKFREDCMTTFFGVENVEYEVEVQENDGVKGYYRLVYPYDAKYPYNEEGDWDTSTTYYFYIHAENPKGVYIPIQATGMAWGQYGMVSIGSLAGRNIANGSTLSQQMQAGNTGTLSNGVITFPTRKLLISMANYDSGGLYYANASGKFRIVLPGGVPTDYSLSVDSDYCTDGVVPVYFEAGVSITSIKYAIYEGVLNDIALAQKAEAIKNGTDASKTVTGLTWDEDSEMNYASADITLGKSGSYTLVAVGYDKSGTAHETTSKNFSYVTAGDATNDKYAVDVHVGTEAVSERFAGTDYTSINSIAYYIYGKNLTEVHKTIVETAKYKANKDTYDSAIKYQVKAETDSVLNIINSDGGMATLYSGLKPLTNYTVLVWATNGSLDKIVTAERTTDGLPNKLLGTGTYSYDTGLFDDEGATTHYSESGLSLYKNPNYANTYIINPWSNNVDLTFTMDPTTTSDTVAVHVTTASAGFSASSYGCYVGECSDYASVLEESYPDAKKSSYYVKSKNQFHFNVVYLAVSSAGKIAGWFGFGYETFTPNGSISLTSLPSKKASLKGFNEVSTTLRVPMNEIRIQRTYESVTFKAVPSQNVKRSGQRVLDRTKIKEAVQLN